MNGRMHMGVRKIGFFAAVASLMAGHALGYSPHAPDALEPTKPSPPPAQTTPSPRSTDKASTSTTSSTTGTETSEETSTEVSTTTTKISTAAFPELNPAVEGAIVGGLKGKPEYLLSQEKAAVTDTMRGLQEAEEGGALRQKKYDEFLSEGKRNAVAMHITSEGAVVIFVGLAALY